LKHRPFYAETAGTDQLKGPCHRNQPVVAAR